MGLWDGVVVKLNMKGVMANMKYIKSRKIFENNDNIENMFQEIIDDFEGRIIESNVLCDGLFLQYGIQINPKLYNPETIKFIEDRFKTDGKYDIQIETYESDCLMIILIDKEIMSRQRPRLEKELGSDIDIDTLTVNFKVLDSVYTQVRWSNENKDSISIIDMNSPTPKYKGRITPTHINQYEYYSSDMSDPERTGYMKVAAIMLIDFVLKH